MGVGWVGGWWIPLDMLVLAWGSLVFFKLSPGRTARIRECRRLAMSARRLLRGGVRGRHGANDTVVSEGLGVVRLVRVGRGKATRPRPTVRSSVREPAAAALWPLAARALPAQDVNHRLAFDLDMTAGVLLLLGLEVPAGSRAPCVFEQHTIEDVRHSRLAGLAVRVAQVVGPDVF